MSISLMTKIWELEGLPATEKLVLLALADWANDDGDGCHPSISTLCRKTGASERTVQGCIKRLVELGHLSRSERPGRGVNYRIHPRRNCTPAETAPPQKTPKTPAESADNTPRTNPSEASASGGKPPSIEPEPTLKALVFGTGVRLLTTAGTPARQARSMVGKWRADFGDPAVFDALATAEREAASDPIAFITATLENRNDTRASSPQARQHRPGAHRPGRSAASGRQQAAAILRERADELERGHCATAPDLLRLG